MQSTTAKVEAMTMTTEISLEEAIETLESEVVRVAEEFLESIGTERNIVPMSELTDFALDIRQTVAASKKRRGL